ncbi:hypothetical protein OG304_38820 [Streptomyces sp. NBC_00160]|uniref:hypothetical protein n=1 Tax=Streptomyces sp. NBC_00160 TaxID=2903628 RepID=UPI00224E2CBB|nr:hypothetical protein [Streptomyces sp. NBC_00160]MCX5309312.1 hypothetical protein [Streptomyces sp. NBC_00160]
MFEPRFALVEDLPGPEQCDVDVVMAGRGGIPAGPRRRFDGPEALLRPVGPFELEVAMSARSLPIMAMRMMVGLCAFSIDCRSACCCSSDAESRSYTALSRRSPAWRAPARRPARHP